jgi:hypothetical protein
MSGDATVVDPPSITRFSKSYPASYRITSKVVRGSESGLAIA